MMNGLHSIPNPTFRERMERAIVTPILSNKQRFGLGLKKLRVKKAAIWAADLVYVQSLSKFINGIKYLLTVIDIFSKHDWMIPLKQKTGSAVAAAFQNIFNDGKTPKKSGLIS